MSEPSKTKKITEKLKKLDEITDYFTGADLDIDESIKKYEAGMKLASEIKSDLEGYELKIREIKQKFSL